MHESFVQKQAIVKKKSAAILVQLLKWVMIGKF